MDKSQTVIGSCWLTGGIVLAGGPGWDVGRVWGGLTPPKEERHASSGAKHGHSAHSSCHFHHHHSSNLPGRRLPRIFQNATADFQAQSFPCLCFLLASTRSSTPHPSHPCLREPHYAKGASMMIPWLDSFLNVMRHGEAAGRSQAAHRSVLRR